MRGVERQRSASAVRRSDASRRERRAGPPTKRLNWRNRRPDFLLTLGVASVYCRSLFWKHVHRRVPLGIQCALWSTGATESDAAMAAKAIG